ncbi:DUF943 family protein [Enterobacteriaceae bacterium H20N1]|uniref:DUF943 family protein n=1 Tax=Dryocola boscaweniae TaxID=2925397 RepID=A0A9X2W5L4_9ENTR|nr:DUF943 family protein [Dryocola boscaweniae]MCT4718430.1 DUF943 family protein [Dryocola boscaweniae]
MLIVFLYITYRDLQTVEIVAIHQRNNYSSILVRNFPVTNKGKIDWWFKNKDMLKERYDIPMMASYGSFTVIVWDFGKGYVEEGKYDRLCFDEMKTIANCIEKNSLARINYSEREGLSFIVDDNGEYKKDKNGKYSRADN